MPKRTGEQALRDDYKAAQRAVQDAVAKVNAAVEAETAAHVRQVAASTTKREAIAQRDRILAALEALIGKEIRDEQSAGSQPKSGSREEVLDDGKPAEDDQQEGQSV